MNVKNEFISFLGGNGVLSMLSDVMGFHVNEEGLMESETFKAFRFVLQKDLQWIERTKKLLHNDPANVHSYLGELRAYHDLLQLSGYDVKPNSAKKGGADFDLVEKRSGQILKVEVYMQGPKPNCVMPQETTLPSARNVQETVVTPLRNWATDRLGDTTQSRTIRNIAGAKKEAHQADVGVPTYLYIDFQTIWGFDCEQSLPILSQGEQLTAGACWMAFYGRKGMSILENTRFGEPMDSLVKMSEDGLFFKSPTNRFAGALLRSKRKGENPLVFLMNPTQSVSVNFMAALLQSGLLNVEKSCWDFNSVESEIGGLNKKICDIVSNFKSVQGTMQMG